MPLASGDFPRALAYPLRIAYALIRLRRKGCPLNGGGQRDVQENPARSAETDNPRSAAYAISARRPSHRPAEGGAPRRPSRRRSSSRESGNLRNPPIGAAQRTAPMLLFTDAIRHNVRIRRSSSRCCSPSPAPRDRHRGSLRRRREGQGLAAVLYAILAGTAYFSGSSLVLRSTTRGRPTPSGTGSS